jgi:hypothetical protein
MQIANGKKVIITDQSGKRREGVVMSYDNGKYLVKFPDTSLNEFWSACYVAEK